MGMINYIEGAQGIPDLPDMSNIPIIEARPEKKEPDTPGWINNSRFFFEDQIRDQWYIGVLTEHNNKIVLTGSSVNWKEFVFLPEKLTDGTWWQDCELILSYETRTWLFACLSIICAWVGDCCLAVPQYYFMGPSGRPEIDRVTSVAS